jgi:carbamoyl-phosphate synthase large subunit
MINCNPETVSTDYDTSDRLYFEPLTLEDVLEVIHQESASGQLLGVLVQLGGQTALGLSSGIRGRRSADSWNQSRRHRFGRGTWLVCPNPDRSWLSAPKNGTATTVEEALVIASGHWFPGVGSPEFCILVVAVWK